MNGDDLSTRLDELARLPTGWFDGALGVAPERADLACFADGFRRFASDTVPTPYLYPTVEGGIQAEWSLGTIEATLELQPRTRNATWQAVRLSDGKSLERTLDLGQAESWVWLIEQLIEVSNGNL